MVKKYKTILKIYKKDIVCSEKRSPKPCCDDGIKRGEISVKEK